MTVAVTGATGFIGSHLAARCADAGGVRALVRDRSRLPAALAGRVEAVELDILDGDAMREALGGCELLYHVAGMVAGGPPDVLWRVNADGPRVAVEAAAAARVPRVVVTSTQTAIGPAPPGEVADEETPYRPLGFRYIDSKRDGEIAALDAGRRTGVEVVVTSPGYCLGAPLDPDVAKAPSTRVVGNYLRGRLPMVLDGVTNFVNVEDVAAGHVLAAERGRAGERYLLGGVNLRWSELLRRLRERSGVDHRPLILPPAPGRRLPGPRLLGRDVPGLIESLRLMAHDWAYSPDKAGRELGYAPGPIEEALERVVAWHRRLAAAGRFDGAPRSSIDRASALVARLPRQAR